MTNAISKFIVGKTYTTRSIGDSNCIFAFECVGRTRATVTFRHEGKEITKRVQIASNSEACFPLGRYSMAPVIRASDRTADAVEELKDAAKKVQVGTVDMTPTWEQASRVLTTILVNSSSYEARKAAADELARMAQLADAYVALVKAGKVEGVRHR
jgi:hypothetical protein